MHVVCLDMEGVLVPEIWINVAEATGIDELRLTTRDISDYDELMGHRLKVMAEHDLRLGTIKEVIADMGPMPGAVDFLDWLRERWQVVILSDTFYDFAEPLMAQMGRPTIFCHNLIIDDDRVAGYRLRMADQKREAVRAFRGLNFTTMAAGDSYNDTRMLLEADYGALFCPPPNVISEFPDLPIATDYDALARLFEQAAERIEAR
ncbi:bifunctional phosphoserine phosphatase/homoserine phosphotransferase ThrH [Propionibacterium australiense]|uniref:phosphoserine phosphatase n=1 Tax=Propionibacterium australiense TaxID=119981 RepID=A0A383S4U0_9ACTN|nr:bifunctional phosphoserine phosphatase/homoserine phosphotransferase ThrH [Propionibacterium australiense]RLP11657.1 bifunctional phosphoserine phosphatase/homoserine phosphotransferase ThrH [Propionibacterium australiense]RLP12170.1 bifunctional phosphoserine phosphatase/homoserine phosphotransferase ThrH [Propionibacterium australiense]SYZ32389.1 HSK-PSP: phosphoserine phosphatase/homoserine phosphotransferase bifunctional protein [Propionibacterium australiense]VEH90312.1 phosphoserine ph